MMGFQIPLCMLLLLLIDGGFMTEPPAGACPPNSKNVPCDKNCDNNNKCPKTCTEVCICDEGYNMIEEVCVLDPSKGCMYEGFYYKNGDPFLIKDCAEKCHCTGQNKTQCNSNTCNPNEDCVVQDGKRVCKPNHCNDKDNPLTDCVCKDKGPPRKHNESYWADKKCKEHCVCNGKTGSTTCSSSSCSDHETCRIVNGERGCHPHISATCSASGDPHYTTFDGHTFDFQGTCNYILATVCDDSKSLPYFKVFGHNEPWLGLPVSVTAEVSVHVSGHLVRVSQDMYETAEIDGVIRTLPASLDSGSVSVYSSGLNTFITTNFGLKVSYDGSWVVRITVPENYSGATCGLCGNFNGDSSDDFITQSRASVSSVTEFGASWKVGGNPSCNDGCGDSCPSCPDETTAHSLCRIITDTAGPFRYCHAHVDPQAHFKNCVFDVCISENCHEVLCRSIESYVSACLYANAKVHPWRETTSCHMNCSRNSHYELCGTDCGRTCTCTSNAKCQEIHAEGCYCDEGFVKSGGDCVTEKECGCFHNGFYFQVGEHFWTQGCSQRCKCSAPNDIRCSSASCSPNQQCVVHNGQLGCHNQMSTCMVSGDPHYFTFDGDVVHFQGTCSYEISQTCGNTDNSNLQFRVVATNMHRGSKTVSFVSAVDVWLNRDGQQTNITIWKNKKLEVDGKKVKSLPHHIDDLAEIYLEQNFVVINASSELLVYFDGIMTLVVRLGPSFIGSVCGMCGNNNGNPADDKTMPDGTPAPDDTAFGNSWKSDTSRKGCGANDQTPDPNDCPFRQEHTELCGIITNTSGPFQQCHVHINPEPYFTSCVYDLCAYLDKNPKIFHSAVKAYEIACTMIGLQIPDWHADPSCLRKNPCEDLGCTEDEWCGQKNGIYGCFCKEDHPRPNPDYYGAKQVCERNFGTMSLSRCQLFEAGFYAQNLHLSDPKCKGKVQNGRLLFQFDNDNYICGTNLTVNGTHLIYNNIIRGGENPTSTSSIRRCKELDLHFSCVYDLTQTVSMDMELNTILSIVHKTLPNGKGIYKVKIIPYHDAGFIHSYTGSVNVEVDHQIYVAVFVEGVDDKLIATVMDSCWATPEEDEDSADRWDLITNRCPNPKDNAVEIIENGVSTTGRFSFNTFAFKKHCSKIFLHCRIHLCLQESNNCAVNCHPRHPHRPCRSVDIHDSTSISMGPFSWTSEATG